VWRGKKPEKAIKRRDGGRKERTTGRGGHSCLIPFGVVKEEEGKLELSFLAPPKKGSAAKKSCRVGK
jgi:hypothetical protein